MRFRLETNACTRDTVTTSTTGETGLEAPDVYFVELEAYESRYGPAKQEEIVYEENEHGVKKPGITTVNPDSDGSDEELPQAGFLDTLRTCTSAAPKASAAKAKAKPKATPVPTAAAPTPKAKAHLCSSKGIGCEGKGEAKGNSCADRSCTDTKGKGIPQEEGSGTS
eukprot:s71_g4.t1